MRTGVKLELQRRESPLYLKEVRIMTYRRTLVHTPSIIEFSSKLSSAFYLAFQHVDVISGTIAYGPEAPNALGDDPRVVAAPDEAAVLL